MHSREIELELDGRRVFVNAAAQEVRIIDADGNTISRERIQIAAGSVQGVFSALHEITDTIHVGVSSRNV